jgi:class 3 adenylate cyclase
MAELPTGTVTFLFTDVEGSTRLLHEHGERYAALLVEHRRVLREVFARHEGVEVDTEGDASPAAARGGGLRSGPRAWLSSAYGQRRTFVPFA